MSVKMVVTILCLTFLLWKKTEAQLSWSPIFFPPVTDIRQSVPTVSDVIIKGLRTYETSKEKLELLQDSIAKAKFYSNESKIAYMYIDESLRTPAMKNISLVIEKINEVIADDSGSEENRRCVQNMLTNLTYIELNGLLRGNNCSTSELLMSLHLSESASSIDKDLQFNIIHSGSSAIRKCGDNDQNVKRVETCVDTIIAKNLDFLNTSLNQTNLIIRESQRLLITKQQCINHLIQVEKDIKDICVDRQTCGAYYDYICLSGKELYSDIIINNTILYSDLFSELVLPTMTLDSYPVGETFIAPTMSSLYEPPVSNQILNLSRFVKNQEEKLTAQNFTLSINDNFDSSDRYLFTTNMSSTPTTQVLFNLLGNISYQVGNSEKLSSLGATTLVNVNGNSPQVTTTAASIKNSTELPKDTELPKVTQATTPIPLKTEKSSAFLLTTPTYSGKSTTELPKVTQTTKIPIPLTTEKSSAFLLTTPTYSGKSTTELPKVTQTTKIPIPLTTEKSSAFLLTTPTYSGKSTTELPKATQTTKIPITLTTEKSSAFLLTTPTYSGKSTTELPKITQTTKIPIPLTTEKSSAFLLTTPTYSGKSTTELPKVTQTTKIPIPLTTEKSSAFLLTTPTYSGKSTTELPKATQTTKIPITLTTEKSSAFLLTTPTYFGKSTTELPKITQTTKIPIPLTTEKSSAFLLTTPTYSGKSTTELPKVTQTTKIPIPLTTEKSSAFLLTTPTYFGKSTTELPKITQTTKIPIPLTTEKSSAFLLTTPTYSGKSTTELPKATQTTKIPITLTTERPSPLVLTTTEKPSTLLLTTTDNPAKSIFERTKVTQTTNIPITSTTEKPSPLVLTTTEKPSTLVLTTTDIPVKSIFELPKITETTKSQISLTTETSPKLLTTTTNSWENEKALPKDEQAAIKTLVTDTEIQAQPIWVQSMMSAFMQIGMTQIDTLSVKLTNLKSDTSSAFDELKRAESMLQNMGEELIRYSFDNSLSNIEEQIKQIINNKYTYDVTCTGRSNATDNFTTTVSKGKETARLCISDGLKKTKYCKNKIDSIPAKPSDFIAWSSTKLSTCKVVEIIKVMSCINEEVTNSEKFLNTIVTGASEVISDANSLLNEVQMCLDNCLNSVVQYVNKILLDLQNCVIKLDQSHGLIKFIF